MMENNNIHKEFANKEIRDFLAQELRDVRMQGLVDSEYAQKQIYTFQKLLIIAKKYEAVLVLIKEKGWDDWDISEHLHYNSKTYFPFVGTEEEYNELIEIIETEEDNK